MPALRAFTTESICAQTSGARTQNEPAAGLNLLPYPQEISLSEGEISIGTPSFRFRQARTPTLSMAMKSLDQYVGTSAGTLSVKIGSLEEGYDKAWLSTADNSWLAAAGTVSEASIINTTKAGITIVGKGKQGMLYGVQTINQLIIEGRRDSRNTLPCLHIRDWPDLSWRCLSPQLTWYAGFARREGFDIGNWSAAEWKWLADWSLLQKCNAWAVCMYGAWPFTLPGYEETTAQFDSFHVDPQTGQKIPYRFMHPNIRQEFFPDVIRYANERGIKVHAYIGKNTYNGTYVLEHTETNSQSPVAEAMPFAPGVQPYWRAFLRRILELGFNGFVFEDPETYHVPNQDQDCYRTFWAPWAQKYGFSSVTETDCRKPPLGVHLEYYTWLFRTFDTLIDEIAQELSMQPETYLISHFLLRRIMDESKSREERARWLALVDEKQGRKVPFVIFEDKESDYVQLLGGARVATLGGRGGAASGRYRVPSINNDRDHNPTGIDLAEEREKQQRLCDAGGFGSMGYIFQWSLTEVFGYLAAQYQWRHKGVPGINNEDAFGFLDYAYRRYYGDKAGTLIAQAYSTDSCVNEWMVPLQDPRERHATWYLGGPLSREAQLLSPMADSGDALATSAYKSFTGNDPDILRPSYSPGQFAWDGYDPAADKLFKTERLRLAAVAFRRSRLLADAALRWRDANALLNTEQPELSEIWANSSKALNLARQSQTLYNCNYEDTSLGVKGAEVTSDLEKLCNRIMFETGLRPAQLEQKNARAGSLRGLASGPSLPRWEKMTDILPNPHAARPGQIILLTSLGLNHRIDFFCLGTVFTIQKHSKRSWQTIFRRALFKKDSGWLPWEIPVGEITDTRATTLRLRFITDNYSRAFDPGWPTWRWAFWGHPRLVQIAENGTPNVLLYDFYEKLVEVRSQIILDESGREQPLDTASQESTGAILRAVNSRDHDGENAPRPQQAAIASFSPYKHAGFGVTIAEFEINLSRWQR
ncbi:MAG: hypothetical protein JO108_20670 [Acidobacteriaceae bacterium]|nr:hypothetical protein [Acidobacteriaceae bacterium]